MSAHPITWLGPAMLWPDQQDRSADANAQRGGPAILRFSTDDFMTDLLALLATEPKRLHEFRACWETWREAQPTPKVERPAPLFQQAGQRKRLSGALAEHAPAQPPRPLKLYQPAHQRYYLVAASLVCQLPGLPDRKVDTAFQERAGFVVRRLLPRDARDSTAVVAPPLTPAADAWLEHAWVNGAWQPIEPAASEALSAGEDLLPLFAVNFAEADGRTRRLHAGLIPVGKREAYLGGERLRSDGKTTTDAAAKTARKVLLRATVIEPWKRLRAGAAAITQTTAAAGDLGDSEKAKASAATIAAIQAQRAPLQSSSWLVLLDLARFLQAHLSEVWKVLAQPAGQILKSEPQDRVLQTLKLTRLGQPLAKTLTGLGVKAEQIPESLADALVAIGKNESVGQQLEAAKADFTSFAQLGQGGFPNFAFPLSDADPTLAPHAAVPAVTLRTSDEEPDAAPDPGGGSDALDKFAALLVTALDPKDTAPAPAVPAAAKTPTDPLNGWFVLRCAYLRPECGTAHADVVSAATAPFQMAGFFDPDAPARPIRIGLPVDTTPAGLRKFDKNTLLVMSDTLCGQVKRFQGVTLGDLVRSVLPWPLHKGLPSGGGACTQGGVPFGTICSISIPIITICALILLMIMVSLLDFVFRWLPYFILCFPLPKLNAKPPSPPATP
jgi:hypothetical protein